MEDLLTFNTIRHDMIVDDDLDLKFLAGSAHLKPCSYYSCFVKKTKLPYLCHRTETFKNNYIIA